MGLKAMGEMFEKKFNPCGIDGVCVADYYEVKSVCAGRVNGDCWKLQWYRAFKKYFLTVVKSQRAEEIEFLNKLEKLTMNKYVSDETKLIWVLDAIEERISRLGKEK